MYSLKLFVALTAFFATSISATEDSAPFGLAEPVAKVVPRASSVPVSGGEKYHCDSEKLNKICSSDFITKFEQKHVNMTETCKAEISQAQTSVCDTWKSGNVSESCAAVKAGWKKVKEDHCLPEHHKHKPCSEQELDKICVADFLPKFEQRIGNLTEACNSTITQAWTSVCDTWQGKNVTASCAVVKTEFKDVMAQGCLPSGSLTHHDSE